MIITTFSKLLSRNVLRVLAATIILFQISGCEKLTNDPMHKTIPTSIDGWEKTLSDTLEQLTEEDRLLLSRYMIRMKLSYAYDTSAIPRTSIGEAIKHQQKFEQMNPDNPLGLKPVESCIDLDDDVLKTYPVNLLSIDQSDVIDKTNIMLRLVLSNRSEKSIKHYSGYIILQSENCNEYLSLNVPDISFEPMITPNQAGKIYQPTSIDNFTVIRAIKNPQSITTYLHNGVITFEDDSQIKIN